MGDTRYHHFEVQLGLSDNPQLSTLSFYHSQGFEDVCEALLHLRDTLRGYVLKQRMRSPCCRQYIHVDGYRFCPKCATLLDTARDPSWGDVADYVCRVLPLTTMRQAIESELLSELERYGWDLTGDPALRPVSVCGFGSFLQTGSYGSLVWRDCLL